jgi:hypothetical protein
MTAKVVDSSTVDYEALKRSLQSAKDDAELFKVIVNCPFDYNKIQTASLFLGIVVLLQVNKKTKTIDRVALSDTELANNTTQVSVLPFKEIKIPLDYRENIIAEAIKSGQAQDTTDWKFLFTPALTGEQARINQASAGIAYSAVHPIEARHGGALIFSFYQYQGAIGRAQHDFMENYAKIVSARLTT